MSAVIELLTSGNLHLIDGAFRAMAMLQLKPDVATVSDIVEFVERLPHEDAIDNGMWFWAAASAANWSGPRVERFLEKCASCGRTDLEKSRAGGA